MGLIQVKGYVQYFNKKIPVTWERETEKFVYDVRKVIKENGALKLDRRLYDAKVSKKELF